MFPVKQRCSRCRGPNDRTALSNGTRTRYCLACAAAAMRESRARRPRRVPTAEERVRIRARAIVRTRIHRGQLRRGRCVVCGTPDAQAHHADYTKPLDITWLCPVCHRRAEHAPVVVVAA